MARYQSRAARIAHALAATAITIPLIASPLLPTESPLAEAATPLHAERAWASEARDAGSGNDGGGVESTLSEALMSAETLSSITDTVQHAGDVAKSRAAELALARTRVLAYDPALIAQIGSQQTTGHWICCPGFACAYGDAVIYGVANSHAAYGCGCCMWPGWGGGNSSFRSLGTDQALLREAYDSIAAGKPTVIHVTGTSYEHWICLMGYQNVEDPNNLTLANFIALDPVDGAQITASDRYVLFGDACEHVSDAL